MSTVHICRVFFFQAEDGIRDIGVTGVQTCALPIWEGLLLVDDEQRVQLVNDEARRLLGLTDDPTGRHVGELGLPPELTAALAQQRTAVDEVHLTGTRVLVVNQAPPRPEGRSAGAVVTLRDHTELQALTGELDSVRAFAESLRAQAHEAANRLQTTVSLVELGRTQEADRKSVG